MIFLLLLIVLTSVFIRSAIDNILIAEEFIRITEKIEKGIHESLAPENFSDPLSSASQERFNFFFNSINSSLIARVRIWDKDYRIIFSDLKKQIGFQNPAHRDVQRIFLEEESFYIAKTKDVNEPIEEAGAEIFSDIYIPVKFAGKTMGVIEIHLIVASVLTIITEQINFIVLTIGLGAIIFLAIIFGMIRLIILWPLDRLQKETDALGKENFAQQLGSFSKDEIGALAGAFDTMRKKLKLSFENLEKDRDQIKKQNEELERFQKVTVGRELKMIELKKEIAELKGKSL